jgi:hypothetical protein
MLTAPLNLALHMQEKWTSYDMGFLVFSCKFAILQCPRQVNFDILLGMAMVSKFAHLLAALAAFSQGSAALASYRWRGRDAHSMPAGPAAAMRQKCRRLAQGSSQDWPLLLKVSIVQSQASEFSSTDGQYVVIRWAA